VFPLKDDNPSNSAPVVTVALIVLNALFFVYQISLEAGGRNPAPWTDDAKRALIRRGYDLLDELLVDEAVA